MAAVIQSHIGKIEANQKNGAEFYKTFFTVEPTLSKYFGLDSVNPADVLANPRFQKLGEAFLKQMKAFVSKYPDDSALKEELKPFMVEHKKHKVGVAELKKAGPIWLQFVEAHAGMTAEQKGAWQTFFDKFLHLAEQV